MYIRIRLNQIQSSIKFTGHVMWIHWYWTASVRIRYKLIYAPCRIVFPQFIISSNINYVCWLSVSDEIILMTFSSKIGRSYQIKMVNVFYSLIKRKQVLMNVHGELKKYNHFVTFLCCSWMINSMKMMVPQSSMLSAWLGLRTGKILFEESLTVSLFIHYLNML